MNRTLLFWLMRPLWAISAIAALVAVICVLTLENPLFEVRMAPIYFAAVLVMLIVVFLSPTRARVAGFLYTRGFSRDVIWKHLMAATGLSILIVWLPATLIVLSPLRSITQEALGNTNYPLLYPREWSTPFTWLGTFVCFASVAHYIWIRYWQPSGNRGSGLLLGAGLVVIAITLANSLPMSASPAPFYKLGFIASAVAITGLSLVGGRSLHRTLELNA